jgi:hypothetical protein
MGSTTSQAKYVLLYGLPESGKTTFLYNLQAKIRIFENKVIFKLI